MTPFPPIGDAEDCVAAPSIGVRPYPEVPYQLSSCLLTLISNSVTSRYIIRSTSNFVDSCFHRHHPLSRREVLNRDTHLLHLQC